MSFEDMRVIAFLCATESSYVYGQPIVVDRGRTLW